MFLRAPKCRCCTVAVGCCVGSSTRGQMSRLVLCAVNQPAISGTCGSSGRQGRRFKVGDIRGAHKRICKWVCFLFLFFGYSVAGDLLSGPMCKPRCLCM